MTQGVQDLINAIAEGDSLAIETAFNQEMASRISDRLDDMRIDVAQNMFRTESVQVEEETEELELSEEQIDELLDIITEEEIEEATLSAKAGRAGKDLGKPGKNFAKIAAKAGEKYGSKERGEKVAGAILAKMRAK